MFDENFEVKIVDFGTSKLIKSSSLDGIEEDDE